MKTIKVIAREGVIVPMSGALGRITHDMAVEVPDTAYYRRRLADGDLVLAVAAPAPKAQKAAKE